MVRPTKNKEEKTRKAVSPVIVFLLGVGITALFVVQKGGIDFKGPAERGAISSTKAGPVTSARVTEIGADTTTGGRAGGGSGHQVWSPLGIPQGKAEALPSILVDKKMEQRTGLVQYGGEGDKVHLGGFTAYDGMGVSPAVWKYIVQEMGIKSLMDVGCGKGVSTLWFHLHGVKVLCVEGSHDAVSHTLLPDAASQVVEHDFSRGPYWPEDTYDAVWCVEFLEHVGRNYQYNYIQAFRKAAIIFASHSLWGGWHHVEVHEPEWWITRIESFGFRHSPYLTEQVHKLAQAEHHFGMDNKENSTGWGPDDEPLNAQHIWLTMQVFINPMVASLPEHAHLMAEHGCYTERTPDGKMGHKECGTGDGGELESALPPSYFPLKLTPEQDQAWMARMKQHIADAESQEGQ